MLSDDNDTIQVGEKSPQDKDWVYEKIVLSKFPLQNDVNIKTRVAVLKRADGDYQMQVTSIPALFSYGENEEIALTNLYELVKKYYIALNNPEKDKDGAIAQLSGIDFLRLKSFFNRQF